MKESDVEHRLRRLTRHGFVVMKLRTPGHNGVMDRMILWPKYAPRPPTFVELKAPGKHLRELQAEVEKDWRKRGCDVRRFCDTIEEVNQLIDTLVKEAEQCPKFA